MSTAKVKRKKIRPKVSPEAAPSRNGQSHNGQPRNGKPRPKTRRATAESMAAKQRDISVSEFFAKNRHLLGFDNPRKALLTTVKEAVDNSLDACEEAGIVPEIWVHIEQTATNRYKVGVQDNGPGIMKKQIPLDLRQAAVRLQVPSVADESRTAGDRHQRGGHVRHADDRQAGEDHLQDLDPQTGPLLRDCRSTPRRTSPEILERARRRCRHPAERCRAEVHRATRHRMGRALRTRGRRPGTRRGHAAARA